MVRVHYRDGGSFFSMIVAKYYLRKLLSPILTWRRRRMLKADSNISRSWNADDRGR
jgi:hypothetical protein